MEMASFTDYLPTLTESEGSLFRFGAGEASKGEEVLYPSAFHHLDLRFHECFLIERRKSE